MTLAKRWLAMAVIGQWETVDGAFCQELGVTRQALYRHVSPDGSLWEDGMKLLEGKGR
jgi:hypothetical protein